MSQVPKFVLGAALVAGLAWVLTPAPAQAGVSDVASMVATQTVTAPPRFHRYRSPHRYHSPHYNHSYRYHHSYRHPHVYGPHAYRPYGYRPYIYHPPVIVSPYSGYYRYRW